MGLAEMATEEAERLKTLLEECGISDARIKTLSPIVENTAWMKIKLDEAREAVKTSNVVIPYDNGGGQKGLRENPLFKGYESLWKAYLAGVDRILNALPQEKAQEIKQEIVESQSVLQLVRNKHERKSRATG